MNRDENVVSQIEYLPLISIRSWLKYNHVKYRIKKQKQKIKRDKNFTSTRAAGWWRKKPPRKHEPQGNFFAHTVELEPRPPVIATRAQGPLF
jgi:hypothetical protein